MINFLASSIKSFDIVSIFSNILSEWYYYFILLLVIALVVTVCLLIKPQQRVKLKKTQQLSFLAIFVALNVVANAFSLGSNEWKFSFVPMVCFVAGYLFGPLFGFIVGFLGDLICGIIIPFGAYSPIIAIGSAMFGFIPGVVFAYFKPKYDIQSLVSFGLCYVVCSCLFNTIGTYLLYFLHSTKNTVLTFVLPRILLSLLTTFAINFIIALVFSKSLQSVKERLLKKTLIFEEGANPIVNEE